ncbi:MAG: hypothetical protein Athens041674_276 [Parcubacteria group bacterium Athens0416_74]|nr:MAG: hypothetical protein Athens041674_276 [Parcubacteria group bacterium Athens0416_74]
MRKTWSRRRRKKFELRRELLRKREKALSEQAAAFAELEAEKEAKEREELARATNQDIVPFDDSPLGAVVADDE